MLSKIPTDIRLSGPRGSRADESSASSNLQCAVCLVCLPPSVPLLRYLYSGGSSETRIVLVLRVFRIGADVLRELSKGIEPRAACQPISKIYLRNLQSFFRSLPQLFTSSLQLPKTILIHAKPQPHHAVENRGFPCKSPIFFLLALPSHPSLPSNIHLWNPLRSPNSASR